jgi:hypothetical protein
VKVDRIKAHNKFCNKSQVLTARGTPKAALFTRISDFQARTHAEVFTRTSDNLLGARLLCTIKIEGEQGNPLTPLQYTFCISSPLKNVEQRFPGVLVRAIHDDTTIFGDTETIFSEGKAEAYEMTPKIGLRSRRVSRILPQSGQTQCRGFTKWVLALRIAGIRRRRTEHSCQLG